MARQTEGCPIRGGLQVFERSEKTAEAIDVVGFF